jgi:hemolysin activation/secretion protein
MTDIRSAASAVTELYRSKGYSMAQTLIPRQEMQNGVVRMQLFVGNFGKPTLENQSYVKDWLLERFIKSNLTEGSAVRRKNLERAILLIDDLPGAAVPRIITSRGQEVGATDYLMQVPKDQRFNFYAMSDNMGSHYTGRWRFMAGADLNSPFGFGDKLSILGMITDLGGQKTVMLNYAFPLMTNGLRLELGYTHSEYEIKKESVADLDPNGRSDVFDVTLSYPIVRSGNYNLKTFLKYSHKDMKDEIDAIKADTGINDFQSDSVKLGFINEYWTTLFGRPWYTNLGLDVTYGELKAKDYMMKRMDVNPPGTLGQYGYVGANLVSYLAMTDNLSFIFNAAGQRTLGKHLDSSEAFPITGPNGAKGIRESLNGDSGYTLTAEFRYKLPTIMDNYNHQVGIFIDNGYKRMSHNDGGGTEAERVTDIGLGYYVTLKALTVKAQLIHRLSDMPEELQYREPETYVAVTGILYF